MPYKARPERLTSPRLAVPVKERHIEDAVRRKSSHCMISEAIKEAYPTARQVLVDLQSIRFSLPEKGLRYLYWTPQIAQQAIVDFDQGNRDRLQPFTLKVSYAFQISRVRQSTATVARVRSKVKRREALTGEEEEILERDRARVRQPRVQPESGGRSPTAIDGRPPLSLAVTGRRRHYGAKNLKP